MKNMKEIIIHIWREKVWIIVVISLLGLLLMATNAGAEPSVPGSKKSETVQLYYDDLQNRRFDAFLPKGTGGFTIGEEVGENLFAEMTAPETLNHHGAALSVETWENYKLEVRFRKQGDGAYSFGFRRSHEGHGYWLEHQGNTWTLKRDDDGGTTILKSVNESATPDSWHTLKITIMNRQRHSRVTTRIKAYLDGKKFMGFCDSQAIKVGGLAFRVTGAGAKLHLDDCMVTGYVNYSHTWRQTQGPEGGFFVEIAIHLTDWNTAYIAAGDGGLYRTKDAGRTWQEIGLPNGLWKVRIRNIELAPSSPNVIYIGSARKHVSSLWRSDDGGESWRWTSAGDLPGLDTNAETYALAVDPDNPMHIFFGMDDDGIYESVDGGDTFDSVNPGGGLPSCVAINPFDPQQKVLYGTAKTLGIYAGNDPQPGGTSIWRTDDGGDFWDPSDAGVHGEDIHQILYHPADGNLVYAIVSIEPGAGDLYRSVDAGSSWTKLDLFDSTLGIPLAVTDMRFIMHPTGITLVAFSRTEVVSSKDGGNTWSVLWKKEFDDADIYPHDPFIIYGESGGEVVVSKDLGLTWDSSNEGILAHEGMALTTDPSNSAVVYMGNAIGVYRSDDYGCSWEQVFAEGDTISVAVDPTESDVVYVGLRTLDDFSIGTGQPWLMKTEDGGQIWTDISNSTGVGYDDIEFPVATVAIDPQNPSIIFAGTGGGPQGIRAGKGLYKSTDGGNNWTKTPIPDLWVPAIIIDPTDSSHIIASTLGKGVYVSFNGGSSFEQRNTGFLTGGDPSVINVYSVAMNPRDSNMMYAGIHNFYAPVDGGPIAVYKTIDGGLNWDVVLVSDEGVAASQGYPYLHLGAGIEAIIIDPSQPEHVFAATHDPGVVLTEDDGKSWGYAHLGFVPLLTHVYAYRMAIGSKGKVIYSTSCGRSVFRNFLKKPERFKCKERD